MERETLYDRRERAKNMDPWETDKSGEFAGGKSMVDPIFVIACVPILGALYALVMIASGMNIKNDGDATGVGNQAIRSGHVGLIVQAGWLALFVTVYVVSHFV